MEIRKGTIEDVMEIMSIIKAAIVDMESEGIYQWDDHYPNEDVVINDMNEGTIYVYVDENTIKGFVTLNEFQDREYEDIDWKYKDGNHLIIHRLCVDPKYKGNGIATTLIRFAEQWGHTEQYEAIRLDTFTQNPHSQRLYEKRGFEKRGMVTFQKGKFICFEKKLS